MARDRLEAAAVVEGALVAKLTLAELYLEVLAPAQKEIGDRWHRGELSIAEEHWSTEVIRECMGRVRRTLSDLPRRGASVLVAGLEGERHSLSARMAADFFLWRGWQVEYLGCNLPSTELLSYVDRHEPELIALSVTMEENLETAWSFCRQLCSGHPGRRVLLGGSAFRGREGPASLEDEISGSYAVARSALEGLELATRLVGDGWRPEPEAYLSIVGLRIQRLRKEVGLTQAQLASRARITRPYLSAVERGKQNMTLEAALKLAGALSTSMSELLDEAPE